MCTALPLVHHVCLRDSVMCSLPEQGRSVLYRLSKLDLCSTSFQELELTYQLLNCTWHELTYCTCHSFQQRGSKPCSVTVSSLLPSGSREGQHRVSSLGSAFSMHCPAEHCLFAWGHSFSPRGRAVSRLGPSNLQSASCGAACSGEPTMIQACQGIVPSALPSQPTLNQSPSTTEHRHCVREQLMQKTVPFA